MKGVVYVFAFLLDFAFAVFLVHALFGKLDWPQWLFICVAWLGGITKTVYYIRTRKLQERVDLIERKLTLTNPYWRGVDRDIG